MVLRQQINVLRRANPKRLPFLSIDRLIFGGVCRLFPKLYDALAIVRPDTVIRWHHAGFRSYWRWKSRRRSGRPTASLEIRRLIRETSIANPLWGAPRIHGELLKLGIDVGHTSVAKYTARELRERLDPLIKTSPLSVPVRKPKPTWVEPEVDAEVEYGALTDDGLLREAVFKGLRDDLAAPTVKAPRLAPSKARGWPRHAPMGGQSRRLSRVDRQCSEIVAFFLHAVGSADLSKQPETASNAMTYKFTGPEMAAVQRHGLYENWLLSHETLE